MFTSAPLSENHRIEEIHLKKNVNGRCAGNLSVIDGNESVNVVKDIRKKKKYIYIPNVHIKWFKNGVQLKKQMFMFWKYIAIARTVQQSKGMF